ncbi:hypothetical membrane protein, conserved [Thermococcus kodakarensis KOD1]|uniref:Hypothetical membrane protein, conserved n=1 Tax=Thermococcus kodakarensis (strain ATCC BAA-918 / JCM 12380 / KOD1) TaxID=69014 RepID=Q5JIU4_THEKO|nr:hypothetical protein [Thermococcus kodakarensis]WCN27573.1 hypothetical protein POG15_08365 [Thermococcus kodakarensis]WCN29864.1 hypothetical protein POG21_08355 [Thermococcus kodakarensis]BAD85831.1 hypothetical membrane protein, conserved [Thermococcus kodakarensis KOD1]
MDFALFMERYGYKILLVIMLSIVFGIIGIFVGAVFVTLKSYGLYVGGMILIVTAIYAFTVRRKYLQSYGDAMGKYFYDPKQGKRP